MDITVVYRYEFTCSNRAPLKMKGACHQKTVRKFGLQFFPSNELTTVRWVQFSSKLASLYARKPFAGASIVSERGGSAKLGAHFSPMSWNQFSYWGGPNLMTFQIREASVAHEG